MSFVIDTNILLYAVNLDCDEHFVAKQFLEERIRLSIPGFMTWGIIYEFLRVSTHRKVFQKPLTIKKALSYVESILATEVFGILIEQERHHQMLIEVCSQTPSAEGNLLHDIHTAVLMREHGITRIYTNDSDFCRFKFLEVVSPWAET